MYLAYLGQSGNTGNSLNDANQLHHVHAGLLVHESQSTSITGEFDALYLRHFAVHEAARENPGPFAPAKCSMVWEPFPPGLRPSVTS